MYCEYIFDFVIDSKSYPFPRREGEDLVYNISVVDDSNKLQAVVLKVGWIDLPFKKGGNGTWTPKWNNLKTWESGLLFHNMYWTGVILEFALDGHTTNVKLCYEADSFCDKEKDFFHQLDVFIRPFVYGDERCHHQNYLTYKSGLVGLTDLICSCNRHPTKTKTVEEWVTFHDVIIGLDNVDYITIPSEAGRELMFDFTLHDIDGVVQSVEFQYARRTLFRWQSCDPNKWKPIHNNFGTALGGLYRSDLIGLNHFQLKLSLSDSGQRHNVALKYRTLPLDRLPMLVYAGMIPYKNDMSERQYIYFSNSKRNLYFIGNNDTNDDRQDGEDA